MMHRYDQSSPAPLGHFYGPLAELVPAYGDEPLHVRKTLPALPGAPPWLQHFYHLVDNLNDDIRNNVWFPNPPQPPRPLTDMTTEDASAVINHIVEIETSGHIHFWPEPLFDIRVVY